MIIYLTIILVIVDLVSKLIVSKYMYVSESIVLIKNFLNITYVKNTGAAFSIFANNSFLVVVVSIFIIIGISLYIYKYSSNRKIERIGYSFVMGGAIGNLIDRIFLGYVVDFIDIVIFGWDYPIFNMADIFIVVGVILLITDMWRNHFERVNS